MYNIRISNLQRYKSAIDTCAPDTTKIDSETAEAKSSTSDESFASRDRMK